MSTPSSERAVRPGESAVRRILVALDASAHSMAALEMAIELAVAAKAELLGLFVEDAHLLRLAGSPQARELLYPSARQQPLSLAIMEQQLRTQAEQARSAMAALADPAQLQWSFRVVRGEVNAEVLAAASETDVLALGKTGWSLAAHSRLGSTAQAAALHPPRTLLLVQRGLPFKRQVLAVVSGTGNLQPALNLSARLAQIYGNRLVVLLSTAQPEIAEEAVQNALPALNRRSELHVHVRRIPHPDLLSIAHAVQAEGGGILALGDSVCSAETVKQLLHHLGIPVFLFR